MSFRFQWMAIVYQNKKNTYKPLKVKLLFVSTHGAKILDHLRYYKGYLRKIDIIT